MNLIHKVIKNISHIVPDEIYLRLLYRRTLKKKLHLNPPVTFNEKLQWLKLHDRKKWYSQLVDKYEAKKYVGKLIGEDHVIPTLGVWNKFNDIDFDQLPAQFVLKCTHDSGGLIVCRDKNLLDKQKAKHKIQHSLTRNYFWQGREWPYKDVKPRIIAEKYMHDTEDPNNGLTDYKFYCFSGEPRFLYISSGLEDHKTARISFVTLDWKFASYKRSDYKGFEKLPPKPKCFDQMLEFCKVLSKGFPFLRVDLYEIDGQVYFSELTFSPCTGMMPFEDEIYDVEIGKMLNIHL